jgi:hypothetical protein
MDKILAIDLPPGLDGDQVYIKIDVCGGKLFSSRIYPKLLLNYEFGQEDFRPCDTGAFATQGSFDERHAPVYVPFP